MDAKKLIEEVLLDLGNNKTLIDVSSKIQIIVRILGDENLKSWYDCEFITGYQKEDLPDYRISQAADLKADYFVPQGFGLLKFSGQSVPIANLGIDIYKKVMTVRIKDTVSSVIEYSRHPQNFAMSLSPYEHKLVQRVLGEAQIQSVHKEISPSSFQTIIDSVRSRIIDMFMDLNDRVFNGKIDMKSYAAKQEIHQVINNNITAAIVQTGNGTIDAANSTMIGSVVGSLNNADREKLRSLVDEIERIVAENEENIVDIAQDINDIRTELQSSTPQSKELKKSFKALMWGVSVTCKATIEKLVNDAIDILGRFV